MKSKIKLIVIINCLLLCTSVFAAVPTNLKQVSCPQKIVCAADKKLSSCKVVGGETAYWDISRINATENEVAKETYTFNQAVSSSHADQNTFSGCYYSDNKNKGFLIINNQEGANLEILSDTSGKWTVDNKHYAFCSQASSEKDCLLAEKPELMIDKHVIVGKISPIYAYVKASSNGVVIAEDNNMDNHYLLVSNDIAATACSKTKECSIDITLQVYESTLGNGPILKDYQVGSVVVGMNNNMKILKVKPITKDGFEMKQQKPFNTIQFIKR